MNAILKILCIILIICPKPSVSYAEDKIYKVRRYEHKPYYFFNEKGELDGYYHELIEAILNDLGVEFEYIDHKFSLSIEDLYNGKLDLLVGVQRNKDRKDNFIYTDNYIGSEIFGVYTNKDIPYGRLSELEGLKFSYIKNEINSNWILNFLETKGINIVPVACKSYGEAVELLNNNEVDATISSVLNEDTQKNKKYMNTQLGQFT